MAGKFNISRREKFLIVCIFLTIATLAVYWQVHRFSFINFDDNVYVAGNYHVRSGITPEGLQWAFGTTYAEFWHPLTWLSLMLDYQLFGLNAGSYHLTNLIFHILSTLLLFWLFHRMTGFLWRSAFVAAFFALHPLHVESVVWIAERKDVLSAFFWMMTLCCYVYYMEKPDIKKYSLVLFFFICALMSKPMVVTLPVVMILLDYWPLKRFESRKNSTGLILWQLKEKAPLFILSAIFSVITLIAQHKPGTQNFPLHLRLSNAPIAFTTYMEKTFWPYDLAVFYPFPGQIPLSQVSGGILLIISVSVIAVVVLKRLPCFFVGWFWYVINIAPVIGIIQIGDFAMADRYTYLPLIGIGIVLAWGIPCFLTREKIRKKILFPSGAVILIVLAFFSWQQCRYWKNSIALFSHTLQVTQGNVLAHNIIGQSLVEEGRVQDAIDHYNKAILINPYCANVYSDRGIIWGARGNHRLAMADFNKAIAINPDDADAYYNRAVTYANNGQYQLAVEDYNKVIILRPDYTKAYHNRGLIYLKLGNNELCCNDAQKACEFKDCQLLNIARYKGLCR